MKVSKLGGKLSGKRILAMFLTVLMLFTTSDFGSVLKVQAADNSSIEIVNKYNLNYIIANGNALIIDGDNTTSTTVYIDSNRNGVVDLGE